uniref:Astacin domain-containing protein n=1 Tax=Macrostomum lignano TaxID=282301 RepID=A0A1I8FB85_9PLAT
MILRDGAEARHARRNANNHRRAALRYIEQMNNYYCVSFKAERTNDCSSYVGYLNRGRQNLSLDNGCFTRAPSCTSSCTPSASTTSRRARTATATSSIDWANILTAYCSAYYKYRGNVFGTSYDYKSCMQYPSTGFACRPGVHVMRRRDNGGTDLGDYYNMVRRPGAVARSHQWAPLSCTAFSTNWWWLAYSFRSREMSFQQTPIASSPGDSKQEKNTVQAGRGSKGFPGSSLPALTGVQLEHGQAVAIFVVKVDGHPSSIQALSYSWGRPPRFRNPQPRLTASAALPAASAMVESRASSPNSRLRVAETSSPQSTMPPGSPTPSRRP